MKSAEKHKTYRWILVCLLIFCLSIFLLLPSLQESFSFNHSTLSFLKDDTEKALEIIQPSLHYQERWKASWSYHLFLVSEDAYYLSRAFEKNPSSFYYLLLFTDALLNDREWNKARPYFYSVRWARYLTGKGISLAYRSEEDQAFRGLFYLIIARKISADSRISHDLGSVLAFKHNAMDHAEKLLQEALLQEIRNPLMYRTLGRYYLRKKDNMLAMSYYESARRLDPGHYGTYIDIGRIFSSEKEYSSALQWFDFAQELDPLNETAYYEKARIFTILEDIPLAHTEYRKLILLLSDSWQPRYRWGLFLFQQKEWDLALTQFTMSLTFNPDHVWSYYYRARTYQELKRYPEALIDLTKALSINPEQASVIQLYERIEKILNEA